MPRLQQADMPRLQQADMSDTLSSIQNDLDSNNLNNLNSQIKKLEKYPGMGDLIRKIKKLNNLSHIKKEQQLKTEIKEEIKQAQKNVPQPPMPKKRSPESNFIT